MTQRKAIAEIAIDQTRGWLLPRFGSRPNCYQAWVHFRKDHTRSEQTWTLLIQLSDDPHLSARKIEATVWFLAPDGPHNVLETGTEFELFMGQVHYTDGRVTRVLPNETA